MAENLIGSLIYGEHAVPKKQRPWKDRLKIPVAIGLVLLVIGCVAWKFANYREEKRTEQFLEDIRGGRYDAAYAEWDAGDGRYSMKDFLVDWGKDGYYTQGMKSADVIGSNSSGPSVVVYVQINTFKKPLALRVEKDNLKLSFSPTNKYK